MRAGWGRISPGGAVLLSDYSLYKNIYHLHYTLRKPASVLAADVCGTGIFH